MSGPRLGPHLARDLRRTKNLPLAVLDNALKTIAQDLVTATDLATAATTLGVKPKVLDRYLGVSPFEGDIASVQIMVRAYSQRCAGLHKSIGDITLVATATVT